MDFVAKFRQSLTAHLAFRGVAVSKWHGGTRISDHLLELATDKRSTVLYVKYSVKTPGFGGLNSNQLNRVISADVHWFCVFLHQSSTSGYLLSSAKVQAHISDGSFELAKAGDYKVHEKYDFLEEQHFGSIQAIAVQVVQAN